MTQNDIIRMAREAGIDALIKVGADELERFAILLATAGQQAEAVPSDAAVVAGARVLNQRSAEACGVNADDQWAIYAEDFKADVRAVLDAAIAQQKGQP